MNERLPRPYRASRTPAIRRLLASLLAPWALLAMPVGAFAQSAVTAPILGPPLGKIGTFKRHPDFPSRFVEPRLIEVWLPPDYGRGDRHYAVLYVHDGQNLFDPTTAAGGVDWGLDETMSRLIAERRVQPTIVVAIASTDKRVQEYMPRKALSSDSLIVTGLVSPTTVPGPSLSDPYLRFLTTELKPFIDRTYRTKPERDHTFLMGSGLGALISLYAMNELPGIFGGAACLSTQWSAGAGAMLEYLRRGVAKASEHRLYFDHGTATLDSLDAPYQRQADAIFRARRYVDGEQFMTRVFEGADSSERSWRQRLDIPLEFLLRR